MLLQVLWKSLQATKKRSISLGWFHAMKLRLNAFTLAHSLIVIVLRLNNIC